MPAHEITAGALTIQHPWARATAATAKAGALYLTVANAGAEADRLLGVEAEVAARCELHLSGTSGDVMTMQMVDQVEVPAGGSVSLDPMGYHLMITGMNQPFVEGQCVEMTLHFATAGDLKVQFNIGGVAQTEPPMGPTHDMSTMSSMELSGMSSMQM